MQKGKKVRKPLSFILAALMLAAQLLLAPAAALQTQAAPVTFPDGTVFDPVYYAEKYPEVKAAFGNDSLKLWLHYYSFGRAEGRSGAASDGIAGKVTAAVTPEQVATVNAIAKTAQTENKGTTATGTAPAKTTGTAPAAAQAPQSAAFDPAFYANRYPDLKAAFGTDAAKLWQHYQMFGEKEGRQAAKDAVPGVTKITAPAGVQNPPAANQAAQANKAPAAAPVKSNGKRVAFIGDSISTFGGQLPPGYESFYPQQGLENLAETWWYQVSARAGLQIVVNASYSRSRLCGNRNDTTGIVGSSYSRVNTVVAQKPDIIFIMIGTNDFTGGVALVNFREAYLSLISQLRAALPNARIICCTCIPEYLKWKNSLDVTIDAYNNEIRRAAAETGCALVDVYACGLNKDHFIDALHPNATGALLMANFILAHMPR
ncbi:MAG: SGNH/GDSL hydrolase family protein [Lachnospiraceae bacterium]|nr:SGNH/GDSL hydrolase family protein [Lachnospiraceae bacterium]